jgi:2,3-bisphosphoglycerate-independent phosphoglycerate mutase
MQNKNKKPIVLAILDGWGEAPKSKGNAISIAKTSFFDEVKDKYPFTTLGATGFDVGLDKDQMSGSEAGHINIGGGRKVTQESYKIDMSIRDGSFFINPVLVDAVRNSITKKSNFHIMGLMSTYDSQHINPEHFRAVLRLARKKGVRQVYCHLFTDGRDSYDKTALLHLESYKKIIKEEKIGKIASLSGRYWAMDRAKNWDRLAKAYDAIVFGKGEVSGSPEEAIKNAYQRGEGDEMLLPTVIQEKGSPIATLKRKDTMVFYNFRSDRARQFTKLFVQVSDEIKSKNHLPALRKIENIYFVAMSDFGPDMDVHTAFVDNSLENTLPIALHDFKQLYISESEKYAHITYFFNGGYPDPIGGEDRITIHSPVVKSYADAPEMSARELADCVIRKIEKNECDFIALNFANADMVGHTGDFKATIKSIEFVDKQLKRIYNALSKKDGAMLITADHGNAENMIDSIGLKEIANTFHTKNRVPFSLLGKEFKNKKLYSGGVLGNVAPTILDILNIEKPEEMNKRSLLK